MSPRLTSVLLVVCALVAPLRAASQQLDTEDQKTVYTLGWAVARNLKSFDLSPDEVKILAAGLTAGLTGQKPAVDLATYEPKLDSLAQSRNAVRTKRERDASAVFLKTAGAESGAKTTKSGLVYRELKAGSGDKPTPKDKVKVHYVGKLRDGTIFDSSVARGQPADFPLGQMIPCWQEGLQLMKQGGKSLITCPADLAYGDKGVPPGTGDRIPPGAALQFEVDLLAIDKNAAASEKMPQTSPLEVE